MNLVENALPKIIALPNGCWLWTRSQTGSGYPRWRQRDEFYDKPAHKAIFEIFEGPTPPGMQHDHLCVFRLCVNPGHVERVPQSENRRRQAEAMRRKREEKRSM